MKMNPINNANFGAKIVFKDRKNEKKYQILGQSSIYSDKPSKASRYIARHYTNPLHGLINKKQLNAMDTAILLSCDPIKGIVGASRIAADNKEFVINIENNKLSDIAQSRKPHIFIINQDDELNDFQSVLAFISMLYDEYLKQDNRFQEVPSPKILVDEKLTDEANYNRILNRIYENLGIEGVYLEPTSIQENAPELARISQDFLDKKTNLFIFKKPDEKLPSTAAIIRALSAQRDEINVVPLGISYNYNSNGKTAKLTTINIGDTFNFTPNDNGLKISDINDWLDEILSISKQQARNLSQNQEKQGNDITIYHGGLDDYLQ